MLFRTRKSTRNSQRDTGQLGITRTAANSWDCELSAAASLQIHRYTKVMETTVLNSQQFIACAKVIQQVQIENRSIKQCHWLKTTIKKLSETLYLHKGQRQQLYSEDIHIGYILNLGNSKQHSAEWWIGMDRMKAFMQHAIVFIRQSNGSYEILNLNCWHYQVPTHKHCWHFLHSGADFSPHRSVTRWNYIHSKKQGIKSWITASVL